MCKSNIFGINTAAHHKMDQRLPESRGEKANTGPSDHQRGGLLFDPTKIPGPVRGLHRYHEGPERWDQDGKWMHGSLHFTHEVLQRGIQHHASYLQQ